MKKTLIALAAVAASSAALAQSSVTLYGIVDQSVESVKGNNSVTRVTSNNHTSSRFGLRGTEDIGGGLKGKFQLESGLGVDVGSSGNINSTNGQTVRFFDRAAWLGLEGGFGELRLGRQDTPIGAIVGNTAILGGQSYDDFSIINTSANPAFANSKYRRADNAVTYILPKLVDGLTAQLQYSFAVGSSSATGTEAANDDNGKAYGLGLQYRAGDFGAGLGYLNAKANTAGTVKDKSVVVYASYDFGPAKLTGYLNQDSTTGAAEDLRLYGLRVDVPVNKELALQASVSQVQDQTKGAAVEDDATIVALKGTYSLSKRTAVYGLFTTVSNDDGVNLRVGSSAPSLTNGKTSRGLALGVVHRF
jgi:GBP family porin